MKNRVVTARIDAALNKEIEFLKYSLGISNTTSVLTHAIHALYNSVKEKELKKSSLELFEDMGMMGCFDGSYDLSATYKDKIGDVIVKKQPKPPKKTRAKKVRHRT